MTIAMGYLSRCFPSRYSPLYTSSGLQGCRCASPARPVQVCDVFVFINLMCRCTILSLCHCMVYNWHGLKSILSKQNNKYSIRRQGNYVEKWGYCTSVQNLNSLSPVPSCSTPRKVTAAYFPSARGSRESRCSMEAVHLTY